MTRRAGTAAEKQFLQRHATAVAKAGARHRTKTTGRNATALAVDWARNVKLSVPAGDGGANPSVTESKLAAALQSLGGQPPVFVSKSARWRVVR